MPPDLRGAMRTFATGVCVASTYRDTPEGRRHDAVTVNSLSSISLDPPLVSLCFRRSSAFLADLLAGGRWVVSILPAGARELAARLAGPRERRAEHVAAMRARPGDRTGALVLDDATWLECELREQFALGDHTLVVGEVLATGQDPGSPALVFVHGRYHDVSRAPAATLDLSGPGHWGEAV
ncbi:flavin reductase family protein [Amycolatopsis australiensis]|uniref:NADH-FMN oxidoreductase RutF, flavin reductase (DIM6/NTAB) family n=1 Tax=Amycolatopsis australiensis TaxID=546364 RepID=A0A1K1T3D3_9PSEU|nr:flavin reductase family protein [Amycolatopsis australiensis]SFW91090.1 NADH-FMN oxidoreductase RutF, flavin reductase (DIM6/NTAB) family [Amycolatopsis australiensis]